MTTRPLLPVLARQLKRLNIDASTPPSAQAFQHLLDVVNEHYHRMEDDRALIDRSLERSTNENEAMRHGIEQQRDLQLETAGAPRVVSLFKPASPQR